MGNCSCVHLAILGNMDPKPPSTPTTWPVNQLFFESSNQRIADATSLGLPIRPNGCILLDASNEALLLVNFEVSDVSIKPGATQFTRMFRDA